MSKELIRQLVSKRFDEFSGVATDRKGYPNREKPKAQPSGVTMTLDINFVLRQATSIGREPCVTRTGVIGIKVAAHKNSGTSEISKITDLLEQHFSFWQTDNGLTCEAATTVDNGELNTHYQSIVYIPFTFSEDYA